MYWVPIFTLMFSMCNAASQHHSDSDHELTPVASCSQCPAIVTDHQFLAQSSRMQLSALAPGQWHFEQKEYVRAIESFKLIDRSEHGEYAFACAQSNVGVCHIKLNNFEQARTCLEHVCNLFDCLQANRVDGDIKQDALTTKFNLGLAYLRLGNKVEAFSRFGKIAHESNSYEALQAIVSILLQEKKEDGQIEPDALDEAKLVLMRIAKIKDVPVAVRAWVAHNLGVIAYKKNDIWLSRRYFKCARDLQHPLARANLKKLKVLKR